jgi:hypothetical protein
MSAPTIEAIAQTVEEVGKEHASSRTRTEDRSQRSSCDRDLVISLAAPSRDDA